MPFPEHGVVRLVTRPNVSHVLMRHLRVERHGGPGPVDASAIHLVNTQQIELQLAEALRSNALAVRYRGQLLTRLVAREMALVLSLYQTKPLGAPLRRHSAFSNCSLHIQRLATEVAALGALTSATTFLRGGPPTGIAHFDGLPASLQQFYGGFGHARPDLRFAYPNNVIAGESRGRSQRPPLSVLANGEQRRRLGDLRDWQGTHNDNVTMAWSWIQEHHTQVDYFEFDSSGPPAVPRPAIEAAAAAEFGVGAESLWRPGAVSRRRPRFWNVRRPTLSRGTSSQRQPSRRLD